MNVRRKLNFPRAASRLTANSRLGLSSRVAQQNVQAWLRCAKFMTMPCLMDVCRGETIFYKPLLMPHIDFDRDFLFSLVSFFFFAIVEIPFAIEAEKKSFNDDSTIKFINFYCLRMSLMVNENNFDVSFYCEAHHRTLTALQTDWKLSEKFPITQFTNAITISLTRRSLYIQLKVKNYAQLICIKFHSIKVNWLSCD